MGSLAPALSMLLGGLLADETTSHSFLPNWLLQNKEWLFSGAGITVLSVLYLILRWLWSRKAFSSKPIHADSPTQGLVEPWYLMAMGTANESRSQVSKETLPLDRPFPSEIWDAIRSAPVMHQEARAKEYAGLRVRWLVTLEAARRRGEEVSLMLLDRGNYPWICCTVSIADYPELLVAKPHSNYWVTGTVCEKWGVGIELKWVSLSPSAVVGSCDIPSLD